MKLDELPERYRKQALAQIQTAPAVSIANVEQVARCEPLATRKNKALDSRGGLVLHIHSRRTRATDADGVSAKACIDGLVNGGILEDDSPDIVREVRQTQTKSNDEETWIMIYGGVI